MSLQVSAPLTCPCNPGMVYSSSGVLRKHLGTQKHELYLLQQERKDLYRRHQEATVDLDRVRRLNEAFALRNRRLDRTNKILQEQIQNMQSEIERLQQENESLQKTQDTLMEYIDNIKQAVDNKSDGNFEGKHKTE